MRLPLCSVQGCHRQGNRHLIPSPALEAALARLGDVLTGWPVRFGQREFCKRPRKGDFLQVAGGLVAPRRLKHEGLTMKDYLGDSVYAEWNGYAVILTTENGLPTDPSNTIAMDPETLSALARFARRVEELLRTQQAAKQPS
jgi:hypothetical protein